MHILTQNRTYFLDITTLGWGAFLPGESNEAGNLKTAPGPPSITKCLCDVHNDSGALFNLHDISHQGMQGIQVMNYATGEVRNGVFRRGNLVMGLAKRIATGSRLSGDAPGGFWRKKRGEGRIFNPKLVGSFAVFAERPLRDDVMESYVGDVVHLLPLRRKYNGILEGEGRLGGKVQSATLGRLP
ncbi:unnamed protein product [Tuber aestivum]|uniref:Uncharacterized protein n=1 Tax=Tuber aestivum TaxID=59557 RepID=A0A292PRV8_9PEZI|nr:unnamed protein product [Tuber aestivum]